MPEWSNKKVLRFLELVASERLLWDPLKKDHKRKFKIHDAWNRISKNLDNTAVEELKAKKRSLMATFKPLLKKKKASMRSGAGADELFQPIWFAFDIMESFLGTVYDVEETINTEDEPEQTDGMPSPTPSPNGEQNKEDTEKEEEEDQDRTTTATTAPRKKANDIKTKSCVSRKRRTPQVYDTEVAQKQINDSFNTLNQVLQTKKANSEDDCDLYAKLLATKLRKYPENIRQKIMYKIDGLLLDTPHSYESPTWSSTLSHSQCYPVYPQPSPDYVYHSQPYPAHSHHPQPSSVDTHHPQPYPFYAHQSHHSPVDGHDFQPSLIDAHHSQSSPVFAHCSQPSPVYVQLSQSPSDTQQNLETPAAHIKDSASADAIIEKSFL